MSIVPPASAHLIWAFPTQYEEVRCFVWEHSPAGWSIAIMFGEETLALEVAPTRWAMEAGVDLVWRGLLSSGIGNIGGGSKTLEAKTLEAMSGPQHPSQESVQSPTPMPRPIPRPILSDTLPRRFEDPFCPHTPFRHQEPSFDADSDSSEPSPSPRRRPH